MTAPAGCIVGQERGFRCLPVIPNTPWCAKHHPDRKAANRDAAKLAARASHARRRDPELEAWAAGLDLSTGESRGRVLTEAAQRVATGQLAAAQASAIAALVRAAAGKPGTSSPPTAPRSIVVESALTNGRAPAFGSTEGGGGTATISTALSGVPPILSEKSA